MRSFVGTLLKIIGVVVVVLVALIILLLVLVEPEADEPKKRSDAERAAVPKLGEPVVLRGIAYTVTRARMARRLGYKEPKGVFVVVDFTVKNVSDEPAGARFGGSLLGGNGKTYTLDHYTSSFNTFSPALQPEFSERGGLVFDVGAKAVRGARLRFEDCELDLSSPSGERSCERAVIDLGLR